MNVIGDAVATLQTDPATGNKPAPTEAVLNLLDKLKDNGQQTAKAANSSSKPSSIMRCVKYAGLLTVIMVVLSLSFVQNILNGMFKNPMTKLAIQAAAFFMIAVLLLKNSAKCCESCSIKQN